MKAEAIAGIQDPIERAREAQRLAEYAEAVARQARYLRDEAIRDARARHWAKPQIAEKTCINPATVKAALRPGPTG